MIQTSMQPRFQTRASSPMPRAGSEIESFSDYAKKLDSEANPYLTMDIKDIKTKKVLVKTVDEHGNVSEKIEERAICPECGETNCPCIARITCQARLDEENAKGVRNAEKPSPMSIVPQSFNQMSLNVGQKASASPYFR
jgi:hypothetical protein